MDKFYQKVNEQLAERTRRAVLRAHRKHKTIRAAAAALGMPRTTFHDHLKRASR